MPGLPDGKVELLKDRPEPEDLKVANRIQRQEKSAESIESIKDFTKTWGILMIGVKVSSPQAQGGRGSHPGWRVKMNQLVVDHCSKCRGQQAHHSGRQACGGAEQWRYWQVCILMTRW